MLTIITAVIMFGVLITAHELGHFVIAKASDIKVEEFSIGMGPAIFSRKKGETLYSLRALPLGGYNKMAGMDPGDDMDDPRGFNKKSVFKRMAVLAAGSLMNFVLAAIFFAIVFMSIPADPTNENIVGNVLEGGVAAEAGLQTGDVIMAVNDTEINTWMELVNIIHNKPNEELVLTIQRGQDIFKVNVIPEYDKELGIGLIGINPKYQKLGFFQAVWTGFARTVSLTVMVLQAFVQMFTGKTPLEVAGPVGIVQIVGQAAEVGIINVLQLAGLISLQLGLINLFPIPALDGSRIIFTGIEGLRGKPVDPDKENFVHFIGFVFLMGLMLLLTYQDLVRMFS